MAGCAELTRRCKRAPEGDEEIAAEIALLRTAQYAAYDIPAFLAVLDGAHANGWLAARIAVERQRALANLGRVQEALELSRRNGFIDRFLLVGPFDNERGAGFAPALPPEDGPPKLDQTFKGKDRSVAWRSFRASSPTGIVDVADALTPREQCLAYLACVIRAERAGRAAIGLGASGATKVWMNGSLLYAGEFRRDAVADQEHVSCDLVAGPNILLVKTGVTNGALQLAIRVAAEDGGPCPDWARIESDASAFPSANPGADSRASRPVQRPTSPAAATDALHRARAAAESEKATHDDLLRWASLRLLLRLDDQAHPMTKSFTARALALEPDDARTRELHAQALRRTVLVAAEKEDNERIAALEAAAAADPGRVPVRVELARTFFEELRHVAVAESHLDAALAANPDAPSALALKAQVLESRGFVADVEATLRHAVEVGATREASLFADFLIRRHRIGEAQAVLDAARAHHPGDPSLLAAAIRLRIDAGDHDGALKLARARQVLDPTNPEFRQAVASVLDGRGDTAGARAELEAQLELNPDNVEALRRLTLVADRLGDRAKALESVEHALQIEPGNAKLRRLEGWMSGHEKSFEDAWPVDADAVVRAAPDWKANPDNRSYRVLQQRVIVRVNADGTSGEYRHVIAQVLNQNGAEALGVARARFDRSEQRARFKVARLFRGGAAPVEADRLGGFGAKFPTLQPGDVVEWAWRVDDLRQSFFGNYFGYVHDFQDAKLEEVLRSELLLILPKARTFHTHVRNTTIEPELVTLPAFLDGFEGRRYVLANLKPITPEVAMPDPREILPEVQVSTYGTWDELAGWWWNLVKEQYDVTDAMRAHFREKLAAAGSRQEKIRAIYDFVVSDVRYVAWEFGVHGYKPYRTSAIFDRRFGDCKDKALLISALLEDAGIAAYPVLIRLDDQRPEEDLTLPLVEHFNHCIAAVPSEDGKSYQFLDGTAEYHSADDCPDGDRGAKVIVVRDGHADPQQIPTATPEENGQDETVEVALRKDGAGSVDYSATARGHHAVQIRATYVNEADRKEQLTAGVNRRFGQGEFGKIAFSKLDDLSVPVSMAYRFEVADALTRDGARARLKPLWPPLDWTSITVTETRRFDILLGAPSKVATTCTVTLPPKMRAAEVPADVVLDQPFARYELKREATDGKIVFHRLLILKQSRVKASDYGAFKQFVAQVAAADLETATIEESR